jgi:flagellin
VGIDTAAKAATAMGSVDQAITDVDSFRSHLGAMANQLEHTASNLQTRIQYTAAARSQILDADYAVESANLAKAQVLQQAGTAMLAQANASTQNVLSLLK